ncbi:MAG: cupin domain-containing protein [Marinobacter sp.]|uniref:cupin domain-containing protein n=1 Tax=Marinobacter sp. TaxID=50741 RepID=UPI00396EBA1F
MDIISGTGRSGGRLLTTGLLAASLCIGAAAGAHAKTPYKGEGHVMIEPAELSWKPVGSMAEGAEISILEGDLASGDPFTIRLRLPPNYKVAPHFHPAYERVTVLSGTFHFAQGEEFRRDEARALPTGSLAIMSPGDPMFGYTGDEGTVIQLHGNGPWGIEYLNPEDDPRN